MSLLCKHIYAVTSMYGMCVLYLKLWLSGVLVVASSFSPPPKSWFRVLPWDLFLSQFGLSVMGAILGLHRWGLIAGLQAGSSVCVLLGVIVVASPMAAGHPTPACNAGVKLRLS